MNDANMPRVPDLTARPFTPAFRVEASVAIGSGMRYGLPPNAGPKQNVQSPRRRGRADPELAVSQLQPAWRRELLPWRGERGKATSVQRSGRALCQRLPVESTTHRSASMLPATDSASPWAGQGTNDRLPPSKAQDERTVVRSSRYRCVDVPWPLDPERLPHPWSAGGGGTTTCVPATKSTSPGTRILHAGGALAQPDRGPVRQR